MVKKLLKYEFKYLSRILIPMAIVLPSLALLSALSLLIPSGAGGGILGLEVIQSLLSSFFIIAIAVFIVVAYILCIVRFQKSMFSKEGYFTLSLPVTPMQLLWAKFIAALVTVLVTFAISILSVEIFSAIHGKNVIGEVLQLLFDISADVELLGILIYGIFTLIIGGMCGLLFIYACVAAGQLVNKHRVWLSIGCYLIVSQVLSTIFSFIQIALEFAFVGETDYILASVISISLQLVQSLILGVGGVFFIRYILRNKVNLQA